MVRELGERKAVQSRPKVGAHGVAVFLAHVLGPILGVEARYLLGQDFHFLGPEQAGEEKEPVVLERRSVHG